MLAVQFDVSGAFVPATYRFKPAKLILQEQELQGQFFCLRLLQVASAAIFWRKSEIE